MQEFIYHKSFNGYVVKKNCYSCGMFQYCKIIVSGAWNVRKETI
jgi:hypothetical protein